MGIARDSTIVVLTGAGISAESGLSTFRDENGLWCNHRIEDVATPEAFERDPALVHQFYNQRRAQLKQVEPNTAHHALARLAQEWPGDFLLVTQNVDDLHGRALEAVSPRDSFRLLHMHGELKKARCEVSEKTFEWHDDMSVDTSCPCCQRAGRMRPHIVWFGEMPLEMPLIQQKLADCSLFMSIGTSGNVYPAAGFVQEVRFYGRGRTVELNLEPSSGHSQFDEKIYGRASEVVPAYVEKLLAEIA